MGRKAIEDIADQQCFRCPECRVILSLNTEGHRQFFKCSRCSVGYPVLDDGIPLLVLGNQDVIKNDIQAFWKKLYETSYEGTDDLVAKNRFHFLLDRLMELFLHREHLAVKEMPIENIRGKKILEIGSGTGAHSALFSRLRARMFSMDITLERVLSTAKKLDMIDFNSENVCFQADAELLPFPDNFFDIVYSNGVLHHTPNTIKTINEVHRVLKPRGMAVVMLYARESFYYWCVILLLKGILMGNAFRYKNWLGRTTEWMAKTHQTVYNPETKVFSKKQIQTLFSIFSDFKIRKNSFVFQQIPWLGKKISKALERKTGLNESGNLLYGMPWRNETRFELWAGQYIGFALNIQAIKKP